ncbi:hypothetical protein SZN_01679 [Streptomyces zinciresistens K42]|uniref:Methyltransferase n=1 Tax=Streptomyces zinciresistens K42 TaxID=700597 RepID=G2G4D4_9ACTN|nr:hypothetical protein SZN_01679 [Streptomyces zinciresistens K42]
MTEADFIATTRTFYDAVAEDYAELLSLTFRRRDPERMAGLLAEAGFTLVSRTVREPDPALDETVAQAFLIARRPPSGTR